MYDCLKDFFWPEELLALVPTYMRKHGEANLSSRALLEAYRESFSPHRTWEQFEAFSQALLAESARILGTTQGYLFHVHIHMRDPPCGRSRRQARIRDVSLCLPARSSWSS